MRDGTLYIYENKIKYWCYYRIGYRPALGLGWKYEVDY
jgi:hypothetical protein